jgi:Ca-activated chloride channel family protein
VPRRLLGLVLAVLLSTAGVWTGVERGNRLYRAGRYAEAVEEYRAALRDGDDSAALRYNLGTALLRLGRYALEAVDPEVRQRVHYNLGQRFLEEARASGEPSSAVGLYDAAVESYRQALRLQPGDEDAKWNYELALREREDQMQQAGGDPQADPDAQPQGDQGEEGSSGGGPSGSQEPQERPPEPRAGDRAPLTPEQAERILSGVEQDERELFRDKLRQGRQPPRTARDW